MGKTAALEANPCLPKLKYFNFDEKFALQCKKKQTKKTQEWSLRFVPDTTENQKCRTSFTVCRRLKLNG